MRQAHIFYKDQLAGILTENDAGYEFRYLPAVDQKDIEFKINYISPLGSFATWKSTKQTGSYDMQTFEIHARPIQKVEGLRPGMSVLLTIDD